MFILTKNDLPIATVIPTTLLVNLLTYPNETRLAIKNRLKGIVENAFKLDETKYIHDLYDVLGRSRLKDQPEFKTLYEFIKISISSKEVSHDAYLLISNLFNKSLKSAMSGSYLQVGEIKPNSIVKVKMKDGNEDTYFVTDKASIADPMKRIMTTESPIGQGLVNAKVGETIIVNTPIFRVELKILGII